MSCYFFCYVAITTSTVCIVTKPKGVPVCKHNIVESGWYYDNGCADILSIRMACSIKCTGLGPVSINWFEIGSDSKVMVLAGSTLHRNSTSMTSSVSILVSEKVNQSFFIFFPQPSCSESAINLTNAIWTSPRVKIKSFPEVMIIQSFNSPVKCLNEDNNCIFMWRIPDGHVISVNNELTTSSVPEMNVTENIMCTACCPFEVNETCNKTLVVVTAATAKEKGQDVTSSIRIAIGLMSILIIGAIVFLIIYASWRCCVTLRRQTISKIISSAATPLAPCGGEIQLEMGEVNSEGYGTEVLKQLHSRIAITGVTVVGNEVYVLRQRQRQINVYDSHSLTKLPDMTLHDDIVFPGGLASCSHNRALYISDYGSHCIYRVDLTKSFVTRWKTGNNFDPRGISVTAEHTVFVTMWLSETDGEGSVVEYTSEGELIREILLDKSIKHAWQAVKLSGDQFVVSHGRGEIGRRMRGKEAEEPSKHRVCVINHDGVIIKHFGSEQGGGEDFLGHPCSIAMDANRRRIYVTDYKNHRIVLLDTELEYLGNVRKHPFQHASHLCFDSSNDRWFIGDDLGRLLAVSSSDLADSIRHL